MKKTQVKKKRKVCKTVKDPRTGIAVVKCTTVDPKGSVQKASYKKRKKV